MTLQRVTWQADDAATAWAMVNELYESVRWSAGASDSFRFTQDVHLAEGVSFVHLVYGAPVEYADVEANEFMGVAHLGAGTYRYRTQGMQGDGRRLMLFPAGRIEAAYSDVDFRITNFSIDYLTRLIGAQTGLEVPRLDVRGIVPVSASAERELHQAMSSAFRSLNDPNGSLQHPLVRAPALQALAMMLLHTYPIDIATRSGAAAGDGATDATVRRAIAYIDEHSTEPITVVDIASAARLSVRGLHNAFQRVVGQTPMEYLRRVRLDNARAALQKADPTIGATVASTARGAGFGHLSRFAREYREAFNERPRDTLAR